MRIAVIGDIHANARALTAALAATDLAGYDLRVFIGDLLTYGVDISQTLDLVRTAVSEPDTLLLRGNHDEMYARLLAGDASFLAPDSNWVHSHVMWSAEQVPADLWAELPFQDDTEAEAILLSHANPFGPGDWTYLNGSEEIARAGQALAVRGHRAGVFGHTHRAGLHRVIDQAVATVDIDAGPIPLDGDGVAILNTGSIGQPRSREIRHRVLWIETGATATCRWAPFDYDEAAHVAAIRASDLPEEVRDRCLAYHL